MTIEEFLEILDNGITGGDLAEALRALVEVDPADVHDIAADWGPIGVWSGWSM